MVKKFTIKCGNQTRLEALVDLAYSMGWRAATVAHFNGEMSIEKFKALNMRVFTLFFNYYEKNDLTYCSSTSSDVVTYDATKTDICLLPAFVCFVEGFDQPSRCPSTPKTSVPMSPVDIRAGMTITVYEGLPDKRGFVDNSFRGDAMKVLDVAFPFIRVKNERYEEPFNLDTRLKSFMVIPSSWFKS